MTQIKNKKYRVLRNCVIGFIVGYFAGGISKRILNIKK